LAAKDKLDRTYMNMAKELAKLSTAKRAKVGALIVKDTHILAEGYNGTPRGFNNDCEYYDYVGHMHTKSEVLHAESNAIAKIARSTSSSFGATLYVTMAPCYDCGKLIAQVGIKRVVYEDSYLKNGLALLKQAGVQVEKIKLEENTNGNIATKKRTARETT
jgi:dCMP deaminase